MQPFPHQIRNSSLLLQAVRSFGCAADFSEPGVGKTLTALLVAKQIDKPTLVVGPKISRTAWERTGEACGVSHAYLGWEKCRAGRTGAGKWVGIGRNRHWEWSPEIGMLVFDEFHRAGGDRTQNSLMARAAKDQKIPTLLLTATPATNPIRMRALGYLLGLHNWRDWYNWCLSRGCYKPPFGGLEFCTGPRGQKALDLLAQQMSDRSVKTRLSEVRPNNSLIVQTVLADIDAQREAARLSLEVRAAYDLLKSGEETMEAAAQWQKSRQALELLKVPAIAERVTDKVAANYTVLVFVQYRKTLSALAEIFPTAGIIHGDITAAKRQQIIDEMAADKLRICLLQQQAGGESISVQDVTGKHQRITIMTPTTTAQTARQIWGRTDRVTTKSPALVEIFLAAGTDDERIQRQLDRNLSCLEKLTDVDWN